MPELSRLSCREEIQQQFSSKLTYCPLYPRLYRIHLPRIPACIIAGGQYAWCQLWVRVRNEFCQPSQRLIPRHAQIYYPPSLFVVLFQFLYKFIVLRGAFDWGFALTSRSHCRRNARSQREERRHKHRHGEAEDLHKPHSGFEAWQRDSRGDGPASTVLRPVFVASSTRPASLQHPD